MIYFHIRNVKWFSKASENRILWFCIFQRINYNFTHAVDELQPPQSKQIRTVLQHAEDCHYYQSRVHTIQSILALAEDIVQAVLQ